MLKDRPLAGQIVMVNETDGHLTVEFVTKEGMAAERTPTYEGAVASVKTHIVLRTHAEVVAIILSKLGAQVTLEYSEEQQV